VGCAFVNVDNDDDVRLEVLSTTEEEVLVEGDGDGVGDSETV
jgi:hypothetical protein